MKNAAKILAMSTALVAAFAASAGAADLAEPVVVEAPVYQAPEVVPAAVSGWYIRGDAGYSLNRFKYANYRIDGAGGVDGTLYGKLKGSFSVGGGIGYQINSYLRTDVTADYLFKANFSGSSTGTCTIAGAPAACTSSDSSSMSAWTVLANAYFDLGTYHGFTPYVGVGIGGAYVHWNDLTNTISGGFDQDGTYVHGGWSSWRAAYAVMAGVSYEVTKKLAVDLNYRYKQVSGGRMFSYTSGTGPGFDRGFSQHEFRAGLRYKLGGHAMAASNCCAASSVSYEQPLVYK